MASVDFFVLPHRAEFREEIQQAFRELNLEGLDEIDPTADDAQLGVQFSDDLDGDELETRAEDLRTTLAALLTGGPEVTFEVVDD